MTIFRPLFLSTFFRNLIFPNPSSGMVYWMSEASPVTIHVYDITGQLLKKNTVAGNLLDLGELEAGLYMLRVSASDGSLLSTQKLRIQH